MLSIYVFSRQLQHRSKNKHKNSQGVTQGGCSGNHGKDVFSIIAS